MPIHGDVVMPVRWPLEEVIWISMATAICRVYTSQGFVIAADGRQGSVQKGGPVNDEVQKIFPLLQPGICLSYSIAGLAVVTDGSDNILLDLSDKVQQLAGDLADQRLPDLAAYSDALSESMPEAISEAVQRAGTTLRESSESSGLPGSTIGHLFINGYYQGVPSSVDVRLFHRNQVIARPTVTPESVLSSNQPIVYGPREVYITLRSNYPPFEKYRCHAPARPEGLTLPEGVDMAYKYIQACCDPLVEYLAPDHPPSIGGRIHIATVTPHEGFQWVPGFEP